MERAIYFDAWFPRQHNYHPSLPPRRLRMIDDLVAYRATVLVWSALGGGSISLPYLEKEAYGPVDERFRFYGFVNDQEFIEACHQQGIKVFGVIFEAQGWEFPVELTEEEDAILAFNELRGSGKRAWMGLREFSQNRYPKLWKPFEAYFPEGLYNSDGERVTDLFEECCVRDIHGNPCFARWVECPDREHLCHYMDRNNPVWRDYLKAIIRIQIDAGVDGVQLDEAATPLTALQYGGCFCKDCMKGFRAYLQTLPPAERPAELDGIDLATFHYGDYLLERGYDFKGIERASTPLIWEYLRFLRQATASHFKELADYARAYAASKGRSVMVSGNFFNFFDYYYPYVPHVDLTITEMRNTRYRQPAWYRYVAGFTGDRPVIVVENPYGGIIPELLEKLKAGRGYDRFRLSIYEGAALGTSPSLPYGAWMGSVIEDAFYAPHDLAVEIQNFLAAHEALYSQQSYSEIAVVYSIASNYKLVAQREQFVDNRHNQSVDVPIPFWQLSELLCDAAQPYDAIFFPEGEVRPDRMTVEELQPYRTVILPGCHHVTPPQARLLQGYLAGGGRLLILGSFGTNLPDEVRGEILEHPESRIIELEPRSVLAALAGGPQLRLSGQSDLAIHVQRVEAGAAVHIIRYDYDEAEDCTPVLPELTLDLRLSDAFDRVEAYGPNGAPQVTLQGKGQEHRLLLRDVPLYSVLLLKKAADANL